MDNINRNVHSSFSSSLLEEIYRSFDDDKDRNSHSRRTKMAKINKRGGFYGDDVIDRRSIDRYVLDHWIIDSEKEKEKLDKLRRNSMPGNGGYRRQVYSSSSTSSSDSSSGIGGGFSSSDTDSFYSRTSKTPSLKPIRTAANSPDCCRKSYSGETPAGKKKVKKDGKLQHALKLYGELKKVKQPISPGGKLASFLNGLFHSGNSKKPKFAAVTSSPPVLKSSSVPSTASSYSRSCLSKTPSSAGRFERRSVRFCPVNVVVDETGQKSVYNDEVSRMEREVMEKQRRVEEVAKKLLKNYRSSNINNQIKKELKVNVISSNNKYGYSGNIVNMSSFEDEDGDEDDGESCCSSDLFELDNLMEIGVDDRYCQELPVYETTHVRTNRAIANGSIL